MRRRRVGQESPAGSTAGRATDPTPAAGDALRGGNDSSSARTLWRSDAATPPCNRPPPRPSGCSRLRAHTMRAGAAYAEWWAFSLHPVTGWARFLFYGLTLANLHMELPLYWRALGFPERRQASFLGGWATSHQFEDGLRAWCHLPKELLNLGDGGLRAPLYDALRAVAGHGADCARLWRGASVAVSVALALSAVGCLGRLPPLVAGLGLLAQDGCFQMMRDSNHRLLLPALCCVWLAVGDYGQHGGWSLDRAVRAAVGPRLWPWGRSRFRERHEAWQRGRRDGGRTTVASGAGRDGQDVAPAVVARPPPPVASSRLMCLVTAVCVFTAAGYSKITQGHAALSLEWARGGTLLSVLRGGSRDPTDADTLPQLLKPLVRDLGLVPLLAAGSLSMELAAPLVLCSHWARRLLSLAWAGFHCGVLVTMYNVNYIPSAIVYLTLCVDWHGEDARYRRGRVVATDSFLFGFAVLALSAPAAAALVVLVAHALAVWLSFGAATSWLHSQVYARVFGAAATAVTGAAATPALPRRQQWLVVACAGGVLALAAVLVAALHCWCRRPGPPRGERPQPPRPRDGRRSREGCARAWHVGAVATLGTLLVACSAWTAVRHEENWPISSVPMFSQLRDAATWRGDCVLESQIARLSRERHNFITSQKSWFALHAVLWNPRAPADGGSGGGRGSAGGARAGALEFEAVVLSGRGGGGSVPALREAAMVPDPRLTWFGGNRTLWRAGSPPPRVALRRHQAPNGLLERLHVAELAALAELWRAPNNEWTDPRSAVLFRGPGAVGPVGAGGPVGGFVDVVADWLTHPLAFWTSGPCAELQRAAAGADGGAGGTGHSRPTRLAALCDTLTKADWGGADRRSGRGGEHRVFVGFQATVKVCPDSDPASNPDSDLDSDPATASSAQQRVPTTRPLAALVPGAVPSDPSRLFSAAPCKRLLPSFGGADPAAAPASAVDRPVDPSLLRYWGGSAEPLHRWCELLLRPPQLHAAMQPRERERGGSRHGRRRGGGGGGGKVGTGWGRNGGDCPAVDGVAVAPGRVAAMWPTRGTCSEYCNRKHGTACVEACDTRGSCDCDERPMRCASVHWCIFPECGAGVGPAAEAMLARVVAAACRDGPRAWGRWRRRRWRLC